MRLFTSLRMVSAQRIAKQSHAAEGVEVDKVEVPVLPIRGRCVGDESDWYRLESIFPPPRLIDRKRQSLVASVDKKSIISDCVVPFSKV